MKAFTNTSFCPASDVLHLEESTLFRLASVRVKSISGILT